MEQHGVEFNQRVERSEPRGAASGVRWPQPFGKPIDLEQDPAVR